MFLYRPPLPASDFANESYRGRARPVESGTSNADGSFGIAAAPGVYSILVERDGRLHCDYFEADICHPVEVKAGQVAIAHIVVDEATY